jgi:hypothetical protein
MAKEKEGAGRPRSGEERFAAYLDAIVATMPHRRRAGAARDYCTGLLLPGERKSVEPMAARIEPDRVQAKHQSLHHVVATAEWDDAALLRAVRERVLPARPSSGTARCATGSWTTPASRRRAGTRSGWRGSTAANSASRTTLMFVVKAFRHDGAASAQIGEGESRMTAAQRRRQDR